MYTFLKFWKKYKFMWRKTKIIDACILQSEPTWCNNIFCNVRFRKQRNNLVNRLYHMKHCDFRKKVMISAGVSWKGKTDVHFIDTENLKVNFVNYMELLDTKLLPDCHRLYPQNDYCLQQDGASPHISKAMQAYIWMTIRLNSLRRRSPTDHLIRLKSMNYSRIMIVLFFLILRKVYMPLYSNFNHEGERLWCKQCENTMHLAASLPRY